MLRALRRLKKSVALVSDTALLLCALCLRVSWISCSASHTLGAPFLLCLSRLTRAGTKRLGYCSSFFMGGTFGLITAPCVGPFAAGALAYVATSRNVFIGFVSMFSFGLGLSTLLVFVAVGSGMAKHLPSEGSWLSQIKYHSGFMTMMLGASFLQSLGEPKLTVVCFSICGIMWSAFTFFAPIFCAP